MRRKSASVYHQPQATDTVQMSRHERDSLEMAGIRLLQARMEIARLRADADAAKATSPALAAAEPDDTSIPPGCLLPMDVAKRMLQLGWTTVRQSNIAELRECSQRIRYWSTPAGARRPFYFLFGSLYHALDEAGMVDASSSDILDMLHVLSAAEDGWHDGRVNIEDDWLKRAATAMTKPETFGGMSINDIMKESRESLSNIGIEVIRREVRMEMADTAGVKFTLQIDVVAKKKSKNGTWENIILDTKTTGMAKSVVAAVRGERKAVEGVITTPDDMAWNLQLRHYAWSAKRIAAMKDSQWEAHRVGQIYPANVTKYLIGEKKGRPRGPAAMLSLSLPQDFEDAYQTAMVDSISAIVRGGPHRQFPSNFGETKCNDCQFVATCLRTGDTKMDVSAATSDAARNLFAKVGGFDFLRK